MKKLKFKWLLLFILFVCTFKLASAKIEKNSADSDIKWTTIDQSLSNTKSAGKKFILVELYTDWCGWCKKMDENTFQDASVVSVINESFTAVKFNAETTSPVTYNGKTYNFVKTGARGANQLALDLGSVGGKLGYPTLIILDENGNKLQAFPGFKDVETLGMILKFYKSGSYKTMDFQQFQSGQ
jgi:thioredoxin-related protein